MFTVRKKGEYETVTVLDVFTDSTVDATFFLIWENNGWRWRPASKFVPPNYKGDIE